MDQRITRLFGFVFVLFAVLAGFTAWWAVLDADQLKGERANKRPLFEAQRIKRGTIRASDGTVLAESNPIGEG
ncbi:MAG: hypothetical protein ACKOFX_11115, partial [Solirubrobacterales bacterium]